jgi:SAM-dependent methyltransferase
VALEDEVAAHYGREDRTPALFAALQAAGKDVHRLTVDDLAPVDEFHVRGRFATIELGQSLGLRAEMEVLDVGCGIGGPARYFTATFGCRVTGIDLTPEFCRLAQLLTERTGLTGLVTFRQGSALAMPFEDGAFDAAYTEHVAMNIEDKPALYREVARVLKPGAPFGIYDPLQGPGGEVAYPVPWASDARSSFLATPEEMRRLLETAGLRIERWRDTTAQGREYLETQFAQVAKSGPPVLGIHVLRPDFRPLAENLLRNVQEGRVLAAEIICRKA